MLRTALAASAAVIALGLVGAPAAQAAPRICASNCSGTNSGSGGTTTVRGPNKPPDVSQNPRAIAAHRVADPISKRIIDKLKKISSHFH
ncbi:hypothetical protein [Mycolicibacterium fortuitum]|uniref:hypothetical protein n=1 Tax=Mycolicibacterium fortuitum TaxID=1766 RepID=UPI0007EAE1BF|nr:hypothetical protein [Mycolicibacterium fortuitum]OBB01109.1 hypothetical protein A5668_25085 [Mycolicibacterium fortuitum]